MPLHRRLANFWNFFPEIDREQTASPPGHTIICNDLGGIPISPDEFGKLIADETENWAKVVQCRSNGTENGASVVAPRHSAGFQRRGHRNTRQHYASPVADLNATVAIGEHRRQWTTVRWA